MTRITTALDGLDDSRQRPTTFGVLAPPLGTQRLRLVRVIAAMIEMGSEAAEAGEGSASLELGIVHQLSSNSGCAEACCCKMCMTTHRRSKDAFTDPPCLGL